jgi:hypothetical protein
MNRIFRTDGLGIKIRALALFLAVMTLFGLYKGPEVSARESLEEASYCSFVIPPEFVPGSEKGLFVNKNYPMESSSIKYGVYDNGLNRIFTNREKQGEAIKAQGKVTDESTSLTEDIYEETVAAAYNKEYGQDVGFKVQDYKEIKVDGFPGYRITSTYQPEGEEVIHQTVFMIISRYRTFTVTMQRAEDDDCETFFEECASSIHVH